MENFLEFFVRLSSPLLAGATLFVAWLEATAWRRDDYPLPGKGAQLNVIFLAIVFGLMAEFVGIQGNIGDIPILTWVLMTITFGTCWALMFRYSQHFHNHYCKWLELHWNWLRLRVCHVTN